MATYPKIEQAEDLIFREQFRNVGDVVQNQGTLTATPAVNNGVTLNGTTQTVSYPSTDIFIGHAEITIEMWFTPDFNFDEDATRTLIDTSNNFGYRIQKRPNADANILRVTLGDTAIADIASATYGGSWNQSSLNHLVVTGTTGNTDAYLNGTQILTADNTAWTPLAPANLFIGSTFTPNQFFDGIIHEVSIYKRMWSTFEVQARFNSGAGLLNETTTYSSIDDERAVVAAPTITNFNDGSNQVTDNNGTLGTNIRLGDGSTASTFPTQVSPWGFDFDATDDYLFLADASVIQNIFDGGGTYMAWVRPDTDGEGGGGRLAEKTSWDIYCGTISGNAMHIFFPHAFSDTAADWRSATQLVVVNQWNLVTVTYNNGATTNRPIFYVNGESAGILTTTAPVGTRTTDVGSNLFFGNRAEFDRTFDGEIGRIKMFNFLLSETQVKAIYEKERRSING